MGWGGTATLQNHPALLDEPPKNMRKEMETVYLAGKQVDSVLFSVTSITESPPRNIRAAARWLRGSAQKLRAAARKLGGCPRNRCGHARQPRARPPTARAAARRTRAGQRKAGARARTSGADALRICAPAQKPCAPVSKSRDKSPKRATGADTTPSGTLATETQSPHASTKHNKTHSMSQWYANPAPVQEKRRAPPAPAAGERETKRAQPSFKKNGRDGQHGQHGAPSRP